MKKILLVFLGLVFVSVIGLAVFLYTLDADQYRPLITEQIHKAIGKPVKIEKISFRWRSGISLSLQGLVIGADTEFRDELIRVASANAVLNLAPLLNHEVQISSIYINEPHIHLVRKSNGTLFGFESKHSNSSEVRIPDNSRKTGSPQSAAVALSFLVDQIRVDAGELVFVDQSGPRVVETRVKDIDLKINNAALDQPIGIDFQAALLSARQNLKLRGELQYASRSQELLLENLRGDLNLDSVDLSELFRVMPDLSSSGLEQLSGTIEAETHGRIILNEKALQNAKATLKLQDGLIKYAGLSTPVDRMALDISMQSGLIKINKAAADFAGGIIRGEGQINLKTPKPLTAIAVHVQNFSLATLTSGAPPNPSSPQLEGSVSGAFQGTVAGSSAAEIGRSIAGEGNLVVEHGVIRNMNILREVFRKLSMIPGLVDNLLRNLPENYQDRLRERDTILETVQIPFVIKEGALISNKLEVQTNSLALQGGGSYGLLTRMVGAQANLFVEPELSAAFIRSVNELEYLTDRNSGALMIPLNIQGPIPPSVTPDYQYIASRLAVAKTQDVLGSLFKNQQSGEQSQTVDPRTGEPMPQSTAGAQGLSGESQAGSGKTKYPKGSQILGALLQSALQPETQDSNSSENSNSQQRNGLLF